MSKLRRYSDLSGKGAELSGGRWNEIGQPAIYLAENISLSILETIVHCQQVSDLYNRVVLSIEVPNNSMDEISVDKLPRDWNTTPWNNFTVQYGSNWLLSNNNLLLKIPSAIVPKENIFLVNPVHKNYKFIKIIDKELFLPDNRLKLSD
jgi:RES domain-containing protein